MQLSGFYFPPGSARQTDAMLCVAADGKSLEVRDGSGAVLAGAPRRHVTVTSRLGGLRRKMEFPDGAMFETADNDGVDALLKGPSGALSRLERSWRLAGTSLLAIAVCAALFILYGIPGSAGWLAERTPPSVSRLITDHTLKAMDGNLLLPTALPSTRQREIRNRFETVAGWEHHGATRYRLLLRNAPHIGPNAFALPDGRIVVTDQMILMAKNDAEIDGVLAHEMAHVNHAHGLRSVYQASLVPTAIAFITGDASQFGQLAVILPAILLQSAYSRNFEQQADDDAATLLRGHGEDPTQLAGFLERMELKTCGKTGCGTSWLGSHPATSARAARLRRAPAP
ncbi:MAG: M48 family metallopeptidase [Rhizomicrobium sp.]